MTITLRAVTDRRTPNRLAAPACARCADRAATVAVVRTAQFVYFRCATCGDVQPKLIPALPLRHGLVARLSD